MLSLGGFADALDEYVRIGESTAMMSLKRFTQAVRVVFEEEYLRQPTKEDMQKQLVVNKARGFPGMFASLDCMHYEWKNCPGALQGIFTNKAGGKSIVLEAIANQSLWIWHAYFGLPGGNNDNNILNRLPLVNNLLRSEADQLGLTLNNRHFNRYYLLADDIYPNWAIFVKPSNCHREMLRNGLHNAKRAHGRMLRGHLVSCSNNLKNPTRMHYQHEIKDILLCCVILHYMIVDDERNKRLSALGLVFLVQERCGLHHRIAQNKPENEIKNWMKMQTQMYSLGSTRGQYVGVGPGAGMFFERGSK